VNNTAINNGQNGIRIDTCQFISEFGSMCSYNRDCGTYYNCSATISIINGKYTSNYKAGVKFNSNLLGIIVANNQINDNMDGGLHMWNLRNVQIMTNCLVDNNTITGNGGYDGNIRIEHAFGVNITNNYISDGSGNYSGGIMLGYCSGIIIEGNQVLSNSPHGIYLFGNSTLESDDIIICKNSISFNNASGLRIGFAKDCMVILNQFSSNVKNGISATNERNNLFAFNTFHQNTSESTIGFDSTDIFYFNRN
jgi:parallel beta-helix repeat protein